MEFIAGVALGALGMLAFAFLISSKDGE